MKMEELDKMGRKLESILNTLETISVERDETNQQKLNLKLMEYGINVSKLELFVFELKRRMIEFQIQLYELKQKNDEPDKIISVLVLIAHHTHLSENALVSLECKRVFKLRNCSCQNNF